MLQKELVADWLFVLSWISVSLGFASAVLVVVHLATTSPQQMWIMNVVWPVTALWAGPLGAWAYFRFGTAGSRRARQKAEQRDRKPPNKMQPFPVLVVKGTTHCGSGCTLGDIVAESFFMAVPFSLFGHHLFGSWVYDYIAAFGLGIAFQYFAIKPMRDARLTRCGARG